MSGLLSQFGVAAETTVGTAVPVTRFHAFLNESFKKEIQLIKSQGLRNQRLITSSQWAQGAATVGGDVSLEVENKGQGLLWRHAFGSVATSQPDAAGAPTVFDHLFTFGSLSALGLTAQVGKPDRDGTVHPFTYNGCKITGWNLGAAVNDIGKCGFTFNGEDETTATALATATYPTGLVPLTFAGVSLSIAGSTVDAASFNVQCDNGLKTDRFKLGQRTRSKAIETAYRVPTGTVDAEYVGLTAYNRYLNGAEASLVALFTGPTITGTYKHQLELTLNVMFPGETPTVGGPDEIRQNLPFEVINPGAGGISLRLRTTDTTP